ncbi:unnamed protein product [marine sediment metagenome]|uniref:Uncharacterized protein n=1 Tax=marine sediment metagenome TaxID=412755 RepID=X1J8Q0_9ZZZZ
MPVIEVTTSSMKIASHDPRRKFISFQNTSDQSTTSIYISEKPNPARDKDELWRLRPGERPIFITRAIGFPERAFYAVASVTGRLVLGFQNEDKRR